MKVLYLVSWYPRPGSENSGVFFRQLAEGMSDLVDEVVVACVHVKFIGKIDNIGLDIRKTGEITEYMWFVPAPIPRCRPLYDFLGRIFMSRLINKINEKHGPFDIIHVQSAFSAAVYALPYLKNSGIPVVYTEHSSKLLRGKLSKKQINTLRSLDQCAYAHIAVSKHLAMFLSEYVSDVQVIGNIIDKQPIPRNAHKFTFLSLGTLRKAKGMDLLIRAFIREFSVNEPVSLLIGGEGEYRSRLEALILKDRKTHDIQLVGAVPHENVVQFYHRGSCFVLPSCYETFGIVFIEAMSCGLPVIATRCGGPEELINNENGILIDIGSEEQLCAALRWMYLHADTYDAEKISRDSIRNFGKRSICDTYDALYKRMPNKDK